MWVILNTSCHVHQIWRWWLHMWWFACAPYTILSPRRLRTISARDINKGLIRHLDKHILKYDKRHILTTITDQTHQLHNWLKNDDTYKSQSNNLWKPPNITDKQKDVLNQIPNGTIYGPCPKNTYFCKETYPKIMPNM